MSEKFGNDPLAELVYNIVQEHGCEEEIGSVDELGWYGLVTSLPKLDDTIPELLHWLGNAESGYLDVTIYQLHTLADCAGVIAKEDNDGFFTIDIRESQGSLDDEWGQINDEYREYYGPDEDDITTTDHQKFWLNGKVILELDKDLSEAEMMRAISDWMAEAKYFPNVWFIDDHGGHTRMEF